MSFHLNDAVRLKRDIYRRAFTKCELSHEDSTGSWVEKGEPVSFSKLYAAKGMEGTVLEIFRPPNDGPNSPSNPLHAKVLAKHDGKVYTFRLTSIERV